jgi:hypothetical protein
MLWHQKSKLDEKTDWCAFVFLFFGTFLGVALGAYLFILLIDPYGDIPFSLPMNRGIVSISDRFMTPEIIRSRRFDSLIIGTSTSRLLDPETLDPLFHARFANLAMDSALAWEQKTTLELFLRVMGPPRVLIVGLDSVWCTPEADRNRITFRGFPDWLYDDNPWNDYLYLFNYGTLEIAARQIGYQLGLYPERARSDGYRNFLPPESEYDPVRAHDAIWRGKRPEPTALSPSLSSTERSQLQFPALAWLDANLARIPAPNLKILAFMPLNIAAQPTSGTREAQIDAECKDRIVAIAHNRGAKVIDWLFASALTSNDSNYWDNLHYRVPIAARVARDLAAAAMEGKEATDGSYHILVR